MSILWQALRHSSSSSTATTAVGTVVGAAVAATVGVAVCVTAITVTVAAIGVARDAGVADALTVAAAGRVAGVGGIAGVARAAQAAIIRLVAASIDHAGSWVIFIRSPNKRGETLGLPSRRWSAEPRFLPETGVLFQSNYFISVAPAGRLPVRSLIESCSSATERLKLCMAWALPSWPGPAAPHITP